MSLEFARCSSSWEYVHVSLETSEELQEGWKASGPGLFVSEVLVETREIPANKTKIGGNSIYPIVDPVLRCRSSKIYVISNI